MMAIPISVIIGAPLSDALLRLDGLLGLRGWQWLFLVEGAPAVIFGIATLFYLTDRPSKATWLKDDERAWLTETMASERAARATLGHGSVLASLRSGELWLLCAIYFMNTLVTYGVFLWLPRILRDASADADAAQRDGRLLGAGLDVTRREAGRVVRGGAHEASWSCRRKADSSSSTASARSPSTDRVTSSPCSMPSETTPRMLAALTERSPLVSCTV